MTKTTIVFIHGLWIHADSWQPWMEYFQQSGYSTMNPGWPGEGPSVDSCRANPGPIANHGLGEIADHYAKQIATLPALPVLVGHSFGGLLAQILLGRGLAVAAVAIDPAPMKGVWQLPFTVIRASWPILRNPLNYKQAVSLSFDQFRYAFANAIPETEARKLYDALSIPAPALPLFQAALASVAGTQTRVNTRNPSRGPLLITGGGQDHIAPPVMGRASAGKYNPALNTEFRIFGDRGHSLAFDHGWEEVADLVKSWLTAQGL